jgi:hypothetical protein
VYTHVSINIQLPYNDEERSISLSNGKARESKYLLGKNMVSYIHKATFGKTEKYIYHIYIYIYIYIYFDLPLHILTVIVEYMSLNLTYKDKIR